MPAPPPTHPTDQSLGDFVVGKLTGPVDAAVADHVAGCDSCAERAAGLRPDDTLTSLLAAAGTRPDSGLSATPADHASTLGWPGSAPPPAPAGAPVALLDHPRYRLVRELGRGGMGVVWLAEHAVLGRLVAVKVLNPATLARPGAADRFRREARAAAGLHHPNVVAAYDADESAGTHFLVMEYVPGECLLDAARRGPLPAADACRAARDAARGLAAAHAAGLVHRDVKPGNLIRTPDGTVKLLDFGLAAAAGDPGLTGANVTMGTPDYVAPEQATDATAADARSDVYALGCTLYHLLAGRVPYPTRSTLGKLDAHRNPQVRPTPIPGLPPHLAAVLDRMTATDPADRYPTAAAAAEALEPFCTAVAASPPRRPRVWPWAAAAGLVLGLLVLGAVYSVRRGNEVITVETDDPDVEVTMRRNGEVIRIADAKTKNTWELDAKNARLAPDGGELTLDLPDGAPLVLRRNGAVVATIRRAPAAAPIPAAPIPPAPVPPAATADVRPLRVFAGHDKTVREVRFSPDGKTLYSGGFDGFVRAWDVDAGKERAAFDHGVRVMSIALADRGKLLLSVAHAERPPFRLRAWDTTSGKEVEGFPDVPATENLCTVAASPDGTTAATLALNGTVRVWDVAGRKLVRAIAAIDSTPAYAVAWSPDGKLLAVTGTDGIAVRDAATGRRVTDLGVHGQTTIAFAPDGGHVLTAGWDGVVRAYARGTWRLDRTMSTSAGRGLASTHLTTAPDGRLLLASHTHEVRVWDFAADRQLLRLVGDGLESVTPTVSADGRRAAAGSETGKVFVWELPPAAAPIPPAAGVEELHRIPFASAGWLAVSPDGAELLAFTAAGGKREAVIFDTATGKETGRCPMPAGELVYAWFIPGSRDLLVSDDLRLGRYDRVTGAKRADLFEVPVNTTFAPLPAGGTAAAVWLRDAAGGYGRHRVVVRDLTTGAERFRVNPLHPGSVLGMAPRFSPDGKLLATTDTTPSASAIRLWDAASGKLVRTIDVAGTLNCGNAFSADGRELVADYGTTDGRSVVGRWAVATGAPVRAAAVAPPGAHAFSEYLLGGRVLGYRGESGSAVRFVATATGAAVSDYRPGGAVRGSAASADGGVMLFATDAGLRVVRVPTPPGP